MRIWAELEGVRTEYTSGLCQFCNEISFLKTEEFYNQFILYYRSQTIFQKPKNHLKILGANIQNLDARTIWRHGFVHPALSVILLFCGVVELTT